MLFLLKAFLWFVTKPFRIFNKKLRSKFKESIYKPFKFLFKMLLIFVSFSTLIIVTVQVVSDVKPNGGDTVTVKRVDSEDEVLYPDNPNGTLNGLNLLLINNIKTESYVKEYLSLASKNYNGELNDCQYLMPVEGVIAANINEKGFYPGTPLPISYLPWDSSNNSVVWNQSYAGYPKEALTLSKLNRNVISQPAIGGVGSLKTNTGADIVGAPGSDYSVTPFQINLYKPTSSHPIEWKSNMNGYNDESRTTSDVLYFPDQLTYLNVRMSGVADHFDYDSLTDSQRLLAFSLMYNPGSGNALADEFNNKKWHTEENKKQLELLEEELNYVFKTYGVHISNLSSYQTQSYHMYIALALMKDRGWKAQSGDTKDMIRYGTDAWNFLNGSGSIGDFVSSNVQSFSLNRSRSGTGLILEKDGITIRTDTIAIGHAYAKIYVGRSVYARMLKYAGVDVDPTNPDTYMNNIPEGEWTPSGDTAWMSEYGINPRDIGEKRTKLLNEAYKWLGSWYAWGGTNPPVKDENGVWKHPVHVGNGYYDPGFDCSRYTQYCTQEALGIDISRTTYSQIVNSNLTTIDQSEAKPGDLVYYYKNSPSDTHHVAIFLKNNGDGTDVIMHAPQTGDVIKIANRYNTPSRTVYRRINGIDN